MRLIRYGVSWFLLYIVLYLVANGILALSTFYAIPFWEPYFMEKITYLASIFAAALLISAVSPLLALFIPLVLFYYAVQPYGEMLLLLLTTEGIPKITAMLLVSLAWFPAAMDVFLVWGFGILVGSVIGLRAFPGIHRIYGKLFRRFSEVI